MKLHNKQLIITVLVLLGSTASSLAQSTETASDTTYWKKGAKTSLTFTQTTLENWSAGGENSVAFNAGLNAFANYMKDRVTFENTLELGYGLIDQGNVGFRKSDDKIMFSTKFGYKLKNDSKTFWSSLVDFKSQFYEGVDNLDDGTEVKISDFMAPGYLTISTGLEWVSNEYFSLLYSPLTGKMTFVGIQRFADNGDYGVDPAKLDNNGVPILGTGKTSRAEFGSFLKITFKKDVFKNVNYDTKLELFTAYDEHFGNIDMNWQNAITMKVNDWLMASFITQLLYDDDIKIATEFDNITSDPLNAKPRIQYKQILGVGLTLKLGD